MIAFLRRITAKLLYLASLALFIYFMVTLVDDFGLYNVVDYDVSFLDIILKRAVQLLLPALAASVIAFILDLDWKR